MKPSAVFMVMGMFYGVTLPLQGLCAQQAAAGLPAPASTAPQPTDDVRQLALRLQQADHWLQAGDLSNARKASIQAEILDIRSGGHRSVEVGLLTAAIKIAAGHYERAEATLNALIRQLPSGVPARAVALNNRGNVYMAQARAAYALRDYQQALQLLPHSPTHLRIKIELNRVQALIALARNADALAGLQRTLPGLSAMPLDARKLPLLLSAAQRLSELPHTEASVQEQRYRLLHEAEQIAASDADDNARARALMALSTLYSDTGRFKEALTLSRKALFSAQRANTTPLLVRLHWQLARLHKQLHEKPAALAAYREAVALLQTSSDRLSLFSDGWRGQPIQTLLEEAAAIILSSNVDEQSSEKTAIRLEEVRRIVELTRAEALHRYFKDDCVADLQNRTKGIEQIDRATLVIYPIALDDRLELLVSGSDFITHVRVPVTKLALDHALYSLRTNLQLGAQTVYQASAQEIYRWLIQPLQPLLDERQPETLVFVPNATLQMVPLAALFDGEHFLIERYAVATTPGLALTDPQTMRGRQLRMLIAGVSDSVQGYTELPFVKQEVTALADHYPSVLLLNHAFTLPALEDELAKTTYPILHLASHGRFEPDARTSYILSYDGKLGINDIQSVLTAGRFLDTPVELLTLSACSTAAGDARAALGLGGLAVKSGAQTVLASLWQVSDPATEALMAAFYRQLTLPENSRARALQLAQQQMLSLPQYRNPRYWSAFVLVGNWQ